MIYSFERAIGIGLALYLGTFIVGFLIGLLSSQDISSMNSIADSFWYLGMVTAVVLSALFTTWYLNQESLVASARSGLMFGLTAVVISIVIDLALFSLANAGGANVNLGEYYGDFRFWIITALVLVTSVLVGKLKQPAAANSEFNK